MRQTPLYFLYGYLVSIAMILVGATWSFRPDRFIKAYRSIVPFEKVAKETAWEKTVRSTGGRVAGFVIAFWGLWIVLLLSAQLIRLHYHLREATDSQTFSTKFQQQGPGWNAVCTARKPVVI